jgi:hypothetical protein
VGIDETAILRVVLVISYEKRNPLIGLAEPNFPEVLLSEGGRMG